MRPWRIGTRSGARTAFWASTVRKGVMATPVAVPHTRLGARQALPRGAPERPTLDEGRTLLPRHHPRPALPSDGRTVVNVADGDARCEPPGGDVETDSA